MGMLNKLFGNKFKKSNPDNTKLLQLLDTYWKEDGKGKTYENIVLELMNGNSFLMFPTENETTTDSDKWTTMEKDTTMHLASLVNIDGLKVLGAFTDEKALLNWTKKTNQQYTAMSSKDVLKFAQQNSIDRIVINSDEPNMFVLERNKENIQQIIIENDTTVQFGTPSNPLNQSISQKLIENFKKNETILEVYQYGQTKNNEFSIVLGFRLGTYSENSKKAAINCVQNALENESLDQLLDLFFLETEKWYDNIRNVENSLFYIKP